MENNSLKKIERFLLTIFLVLGLVAIIGIILLIRFGNDEKDNIQEQSTKEVIEEDPYDWEAGLSDNTLWLPENCKIYSQIPEFSFTDEQGNLHKISDFEGKPTVVVFWASWCSDCQEQMPFMKQYMESAKTYEDIQFVYINKTDGEKETKESAISYFENLGLDETIYFDEELKAYDRLGIHNIPTTLFLDKNGIITAWTPKQITELSKFDALLQKSIYGGSYATSEFVTSKLMDSQGGIHSIYGESDSVTQSSDILSESEGAMLEYAVLSRNKELFERVLNYIKAHLQEEGLTSWKVTADKASDVNALIDDLRIYGAIVKAQESWGGYEEILDQYNKQLVAYGIHNGEFVDFYDTESKSYADRFTLCYGDLKTMKKLAENNSEVQAAYNACKAIVVNGQISEEFPLYYSWYSYKNKNYETDDLNSAEAMVTLLHLAEVDLLPENSIEWMKEQMEQSGVKARYTVKGKVVEGYNYDSTAVYALIAMIGVEVEDASLIDAAVKKMEKMRIDDRAVSINGAFGNEDGSGITSFDQIMPLLAYMKINGK